jgi:hypothetical protein
MNDLYEKIKNLDENSRIKFGQTLLEVLESPKDYPEIYCEGIDHINPSEARVAEILYTRMFGSA